MLRSIMESFWESLGENAPEDIKECLEEHLLRHNCCLGEKEKVKGIENYRTPIYCKKQLVGYAYINRHSLADSVYVTVRGVKAERISDTRKITDTICLLNKA